jgi:hypothetical protein
MLWIILEWTGSLMILLSIILYGQRCVWQAASVGLLANVCLGTIAVELGLMGVLFMTLASSGLHFWNIGKEYVRSL